LFTGELMKIAQRFIMEGVHPRVITEGIELAK
jgi:chaperonin GroEL (HSP60 family)